MGIEKLGFNEWQNGEILWIIDLIAPLDGTDKMLEELKIRCLKVKNSSIKKEEIIGKVLLL